MTTDTDTITGWRTVATHGQPTDPDLPALIDDGRSLFTVRVRMGALLVSDTRWIPLAELDALPDAPPPPRTVTIEVSADDAREVLENDWRPQVHFTWRVLAAVKAALDEAQEI